LLTLLCVINGHAQNTSTIIAYYNLLASYDDDIKLHQLSEENGIWYSSIDQGKSKIPITVDSKNDFLEIKDKEFGGTFTLQLSLFKTTDGNIYIGLVKNHLDIFLHGEIHILKLRNGRWNDVTTEVMPTLTYKDFSEPQLGLAAAAYDADLEHHLEFGYQLPTNGRTVKAEMQTQILQEKCNRGAAEVKDYCRELESITYTSIELIWNAKAAKFTLGEKKE
jgi:hypothetical protein